MIKKTKIKNQKLKIDINIQKSFVNFEFWLVVLLFTFCFLHFDCYAQSVSVSSSELVNNAKIYDGKTVVYTGEAIGDVMVRGEFAWVNVNDGENAIGIWLNKESAQKIKFTGSYHSKGDRLEITGIFHRNCTAHGGDLDIHAQETRTISNGNSIVEKLDTTLRNLVYAFLVVLLFVLIFVRYRKSL